MKSNEALVGGVRKVKRSIPRDHRFRSGMSNHRMDSLAMDVKDTSL